MDSEQIFFITMKGLEENNLYEFLKRMTKPVILFGKKAGNLLPAPKKGS